jgi:glutamine amidotransferase
VSVLRTGDGVVLASEPYDDGPGRQEIPDRHFVHTDDDTVQWTALRGPA